MKALIRLGNTDPAEQIHGPGPDFPPGEFSMDPEQFLNLAPYGVYRIQGGLGVLKDHGDFFPPDMPHFRQGQGQEVPALKKNFPLVCYAAGMFQKPQDGLGGDAFSAPRFSDDAGYFSGGEGKTYPIHGGHPAPESAEMGFQIFYFQ
jgi:hypothetical protein